MQYLKRNEHGLTLIELLATLVITIMIGLIAYSILFSGFKTHERVKIESNLRDEADLIMGALISELFPIKESEITEKHLPESSTTDYYLESEDGKKYGFIGGRLFIGEEQEAKNVLQGDKIILTDDTKITEIDDGQYNILISLKWINNNQILTTQSEISTINDKE